mmetsp:Transcript_19232/g.56765  ORF Transcript_19232/g.56765 Transcript_19232/m.56765 type:complete len:211 (-) Transcript_19232:60-692(-)
MREYLEMGKFSAPRRRSGAVPLHRQSRDSSSASWPSTLARGRPAPAACPAAAYASASANSATAASRHRLPPPPPAAASSRSVRLPWACSDRLFASSSALASAATAARAACSASRERASSSASLFAASAIASSAVHGLSSAVLPAPGLYDDGTLQSVQPCSLRYRSASSAACAPEPALVMAWRYWRSATSPAAKTPATLVRVERPASLMSR